MWHPALLPGPGDVGMGGCSGDAPVFIGEFMSPTENLISQLTSESY